MTEPFPHEPFRREPANDMTDDMISDHGISGPEASGHDPYEQWDAAYVFGALDPHERAEFERHMTGCPDCRASVDTARSTLAMLGTANGSLLADTPPMPETLLPGLLHRARRERRSRRIGIGLLASAAAACLIALVVAVWPTSSNAPSVSRPQARAMVAVVQSNITATASLQSKPWGTEIDVHCKYANTNEQDHWTYWLRVVDRSGRSHSAGAWEIRGGHAINFVGGTEVHRDRIARVQVTLPDGTPVLQLSL